MTIKICFIVLDAYPVINPAIRLPFGGIETEAWLTLRTLAEADNLEISMAVRTTGPVKESVCDGVKIIPLIEPYYYIRKNVSEHIEILPRFPWIKLKHWSMHLLWQIPLLACVRPFRKPAPAPLSPVDELAALDVDAYCYFGVTDYSARVVTTAQQTGRRYLQRISSDADLEVPADQSEQARNYYGQSFAARRYTLEHADCIIAQKPAQQEQLLRDYGRKSQRIPNPIEMSRWNTATQIFPRALQHLPERYVFWVGRADEHQKRPKICYEIARACPEVAFVMIVNTGSEDVHRYLQQHQPSNVTIIERIPFEQMPILFSHAACYLSTSSGLYEGFPNVFLQSACSGVPIVSLEVCPEFIQDAKAGLFADGDQQQLISFVRDLWQNPVAANEYGAAAREYIAEHHDHRQVVRQWMELIQACVNQPG